VSQTRRPQQRLQTSVFDGNEKDGHHLPTYFEAKKTYNVLPLFPCYFGRGTARHLCKR
jgi:hypothetical protein